MVNRVQCFLWPLLLAIGFVLIPALAHSTTYYVATTGSDTNTCTQAQDSSTPKQTINAALNCLGTAAGAGAGQTVQVAPGTYVETIDNNLPGGTAWDAPFTLTATTLGTVTLQPPTGTDRCLTIARSTSKYALISGLVCDARNATYEGIKITDSSSGAASFIRLQDLEIKNAKTQGLFIPRSTDNELSRLLVHDNGTTDNADHGIYIGEGAHRTVLEDSTVYNNHAYGIQLYGTTAPPDGCIIRNNRVYTNGTGGLTIWTTNALVSNNLISNNHTAAGNLLGSTKAGLKVGSNSSGVKLYNNTVYGQKANSGDIGIEVAAGAVNTEIKNNIAYTNAINLADSGTGTVLAANLTSDPKFVDAPSGNFALQAGSPAIDKGITLSAVPDDYAGVSRPQGLAYDIGAYEFVSVPVAFDFSLANGGNQSVTQGAAALTTLTATLVSGTAQAVSFSAAGLPTGATAAFSPTTCSPTCSTTLTVSTSASTPTSTYTITVTGTGGGVTRTTSFALTVTAAAFDFALTNGGNQSVMQSASVSTTLTATLVSGTAQAVSFSAAGLPTGATAVFSPTTCAPTCSTTLTVSTSALTPTSTYTITVTGTGGGVTRTTSFALTVTAAAFDFALTNSGDQSVTQGASASNTLTATLVSGTAQAVSFSAAGLPTGATAAFSPTNCSPTCSTTLTVSTSASTPTGIYTITVTGTGGGVSKTTSFSLTLSALVAAGPIANWKFDETTGQTLLDSTGNGNTGYLGTNTTAETADPARTVGKVNNALKFDGTDDRVTIANTPALNTLLSFTYTAWIYPTGWGTNGLGRILAKESATKLDDFYFHVNSFDGNTLDVNLFNTAGTGFKSLAAAKILTLNTWQQVAVTYNDSGDRKLHLFLNGTEVAYQRQDTLTGLLKLTSNPLIIGNRLTGDRTFQGSIDEVAVYSRALSAAEIQTLYTPSTSSSFDFSLTTGGSKAVSQGAAVSTTVGATLVAGSAQAVSFSATGLPTGTTAAFSSTACAPTCSSGLTLSTTPSTPTGTYTITVTGTGGGVTRTTSFSLTVDPASSSFDFALTNGGNQSVTQGASVSNTVSATLVAGTAQAVSFSATGLPTGATAAFSSTACSPTCSTTLTLSTVASTPPGTSTITMTGTGGGVTKTTSFTLTVSSGSPPSSCLQGTGPLVTLSGVKTSAYQNTSLADNTRIDASTAQFLTTNSKAVTVGGGSNICFYGGELLGQQPPSTSWNTMHDFTGIYPGTVKPFFHLENMRIFDNGDSVGMDPGGMNWTIRGVYAKYMRDDCVEDDFLFSGTIDDSLFDGCYDGISAKPWSGQSPNPGDGSNNVITMKNSLLRLQAMDAAYSGPLPNHNSFWKWDPKAPKVALYNNIFRADEDSWETGSGSQMWMGPPPGKLADCENNVMVWLGAGNFNDVLRARGEQPLPATFNGKPCFTITTDKSVWDTAVAQWKANHPTLVSDAGAPIVSLFSPGTVGSTTLKGTVTLTATAVDDRAVAGVQFKLNGQNLGGEVSSESAPTKFKLTWDSHGKANGTYTLTATARDASGNTKTSTGVSVTISN